MASRPLGLARSGAVGHVPAAPAADPRLMGLLDVDFTAEGLSVAREVLPAGGWAVRVVHSTDLDRLPAEAARAAPA